ncbi:hypothetical protein ONZ45_g2532 [Pleurotus djamor]|nr:hypothetical protein ONZ45_g2532 [Pleurotus djamor]
MVPSNVSPTASSFPSSSGSRDSPVEEVERRQQAAPLPSKRGEIGYREDIHGRSGNRAAQTVVVDMPMPSRHPADRDLPATPAATVTAGPSSVPLARTQSSASTSTSINSQARSKANQKGLLGFLLKGNKVPSYQGFRLTTLLTFILQILVFCGTIAAWVISAQRVQPSGRPSPGASSYIFVHVVFAIAALGQLIFIERRVFRLRAERYAHLHAGEMLPTSRHHNSNMDSIIALSPWNRPPLPNYAAALAQSGVGTGDVEDHLIAAPPPPAYGNTRGSTLLLAGFMPNTLQRPISRISQRLSALVDSDRPSRPVSYRSRDEDWEEVCDAERARRLEETLSRLERPTSRVSHQSRT